MPEMGIRGSALATVIAQAVSTAWLLQRLGRRHHLLAFGSWTLDGYLATCRRIIGFAVPSVLSMVLIPVSASVIVWILSDFGNEAVAACSAAGRIEMFAFVIPMALGISLTPFVSQNFGAARLDRIRTGIRFSVSFAVLYGGGIAVLFFTCAPWIARAFSRDPKVLDVLVAYIRIISFGYGMMEVHRYCGFILTGLRKPALATTLNAIRVLVILIPLSWLGARSFGVRGLFLGRLTTDLVSGCIGLATVRFVFASVRRNAMPSAP
jgi:Na+-driven multidrug efflux pump